MEYMKLNNDVKIPAAGFGVFQIPPENTKQAILDALEAGYRSLDTAQAYFNEEDLGQAIQESEVDREELFITTKNWINNAGYENTKKGIDKSLEKLNLDYIDVFMIHQPFGDYYGSWRAMEEYYKEGKIRALGLANFYPDRLMDLVLNNDITPQINQVETNVFCQQIEAHKVMEELNVQHQAWGPFASGAEGIFDNPTLIKIGEKYSKSPAQVILRWLYQTNVNSLCKSTKLERMKQNINIFDFKLSNEDLEEIKRLDTGKSQYFSHQDPQMVKMLTEQKV